MRLKDNEAFKSIPESMVMLNNIKTQLQEVQADKKVIHVYTDGSCVGDFRLGARRAGSGVYLVDLCLKTTDKYSVRIKDTYISDDETNNQAELYAVYFAIQEIISRGVTGYTILIITDSAYVIGCFTKWYHNWKKNGFVNSKKQVIKNKKLIIDTHKALKSVCKQNVVTFKHILSHGKGNAKSCPFYEGNKIADTLANDATLLD